MCLTSVSYFSWHPYGWDPCLFSIILHGLIMGLLVFSPGLLFLFVSNCDMSFILSHLQANKLVCHSFIDIVLSLVKSSTFNNQIICYFPSDFFFFSPYFWMFSEYFVHTSIIILIIFCSMLSLPLHCGLLKGLLSLYSLTEHFTYNKRLTEVYWFNKCIIPWWVPIKKTFLFWWATIRFSLNSLHKCLFP